jgi:hypothetical protein
MAAPRPRRPSEQQYELTQASTAELSRELGIEEGRKTIRGIVFPTNPKTVAKWRKRQSARIGRPGRRNRLRRFSARRTRLSSSPSDGTRCCRSMTASTLSSRRSRISGGLRCIDAFSDNLLTCPKGARKGPVARDRATRRSPPRRKGAPRLRASGRAHRKHPIRPPGIACAGWSVIFPCQMSRDSIAFDPVSGVCLPVPSVTKQTRLQFVPMASEALGLARLRWFPVFIFDGNARP